MVKQQFLWVLGVIPAILCVMPSAAYAGWEQRLRNELGCELQPQTSIGVNGVVTYGLVEVCGVNVQPVLRWEYVPDAAPNDRTAPASSPPNSSASSPSHQSDSPNVSPLVDNMVEDLLQDIAPQRH